MAGYRPTFFPPLFFAPSLLPVMVLKIFFFWGGGGILRLFKVLFSSKASGFAANDAVVSTGQNTDLKRFYFAFLTKDGP